MKKNNLRDVVIILSILIVFSITFNTTSIYNWAFNQKIGGVRTFFLTIITPIKNITDSLYLSAPYSNSRAVFLRLTENKNNTSIENTVYDLTSDHEELFSIDRKLSILLLGDSMMKEAFSFMFKKSLVEEKSILTTTLASYASGLSRPDFFDWNDEVDNIFANKKFDTIVATLGMNDAQDIEYEGIKYFLNTEKWDSLYKNRARNFISKLSNNTDRIYWIGIPPMRDKRYDDRMRKINSLYMSVCNEFENVFFIDITPFVSYQNKYSDYLKINNKTVKVRLSDGKHLTNDGAKLITDFIVSLIKKDFKFEYTRTIFQEEMIDIIDY